MAGLATKKIRAVGGISSSIDVDASTTRASTGSTVGRRGEVSVSHFSSKYQKIRALANGLYIRLLYI